MNKYIILTILLFTLSNCTYELPEPITKDYNNNFTIAFISDTQTMADLYPNYFNNMTKFLCENKERLNIKFVIHGGDIVEHWADNSEWITANNSIKILDDCNLPYSVAAGNHDFSTGNDPVINDTYFLKYFPASRYENNNHYQGNIGNNTNNWVKFNVNGQDYGVISLTYTYFTPTDEILNWGANIVKNNPQVKFIINNHANVVGWHGNFSNYLGNNEGIKLYNNFKNFTNVFMMIGGHYPIEFTRTDEYNFHNITSITRTFNDRGINNYGDNWLSYYTFYPEENYYEAFTQQTLTLHYEKDNNSHYNITMT